MNTLKLHPDEGGRPLVIDRTLVRIGRETDSDICISDPSVSRQHAEIEWRDGQWCIFDLGSSNGVRLEGQAVPSAYLVSGQRLMIGKVGYRVEVEGMGSSEATMLASDFLKKKPQAEATVVMGAPMRMRPPVAADPTPERIRDPLPPYQSEPRREVRREVVRDGSMTALTTVVVAIAVVLTGVELYQTFGPGRVSSPPAAAEPQIVEEVLPITGAAPRPASPATGAGSVSTLPAPDTTTARGSILITTDQAATVTVDGQQSTKLAPAGLKKFEVTPGDHVVRYRGEGWQTDVVARVRAGQQTLIRPDQTGTVEPGGALR